MKKRILALLLSSLLVVSAFTACGNNGDDPQPANDGADAAVEEDTDDADEPDAPEAPAVADGEAIHLTWWKLNDHIDSAGMDRIIADFQEMHPGVTVEVSGHSNETLHQNLQISAMNDTLPSMWFQWGGSLGGRYVLYGVSRDLTEYAAANNWDQKFTAASLDLMTLHGELAFYPRSLNVLTVYYRKDIFEDLGLEVPTTMDEFHEVVEAIHDAGIIPVNTASVPGWHIMRIWEQFLEHYAGADQHDALQIFDVEWEDNEAVINSFATLQRYAESGFFPDGFISMEAADLVMLLYPGFAAMQIEGQWFDTVILNDDQDIELYGYFALPSGGSNRVSAFGEGFMFNDNLTDAEFEMAVAFLDHFFEQQYVDAYPTMYPTPLQFIGRGDVAPEFVNVPSIFETASANGTFTINDQALPPIVVDALFSVLDYVSLGQMTPEEAASFMQRAIERHLAGEE